MIETWVHMLYNVYIVCNYQDDIIYGAYSLKKRTLGYVCNHGTIECKETIGIIIPYYAVLCCVTEQVDKGLCLLLPNFLGKEVSS